MDLTQRHPLTLAEQNQVRALTNSGNLYYDYTPLIERARNYAYYCCRTQQNLMAQLGNLVPTPLGQLFAKTGVTLNILPGFICEFGFNLYWGDQVQVGRQLKIIDCAPVTIGNRVVIGHQVGLYTSNHAEDPTLRAQHWCQELPITVGDDVWLGDQVTVRPGVTIGPRTCVLAGSVVIQDLPSDCFAQ